MTRFFARTGPIMATTALAAAVPLPAHADWIASWAAAPQQPHPGFGPVAATPSFQNRTLRQVLRVSAGGSAVRLLISNAYGTTALAIGGASIALVDDNGHEIAGTVRRLSFGSAPTAQAARGAPLLSDAVALRVPALAHLAVTLYLPGDTGPCTCHQSGLEATEVSPPGDFTQTGFTADSTAKVGAFLAAVEVDAPSRAATLVTLGDSITDGVGSTPGAARRWPDDLATRLARRGHRAWGVANEAISGNRLLGDGAGENALARLDRDVFGLPGVRALIVFEGVNDIGTAFGEPGGPFASYTRSLPDRMTDAADMIAGYRQIIARAHVHGIKVIGATIAPFKGATYWSPAGEAVRQQVNAFIRSGAFDAVLDFDRVLADPADPQAIRSDYHMGDHLHGSDAGYQAL
ncbi:MAG: SGNH/GDSL hydrolase family protein, partial [Sphingomonadales bacterium]|nr:SGNH/GDSL hydrolase family protein [Sphingomonadales bacterium]